MKKAQRILRNTALVSGALALAALIAACSGNLLTEIRIASVPAGAEIAVLVDGAAVESGSEKDLGVWSISAAPRAVTVTIRNTGGADLELESNAVSLAGDLVFDTSGLATALRLAPGSSGSFSVTFDPSATTTTQTVVSIRSNDPDRPSFSFTLRGTGSNNAGLFSSTPVHNATGVLKGSNVTIVYSKLLDHGTIDAVSGTANVTITPSVSFVESHSDASGRTTITLNPSSDLTPGTQYTVRVNQNIGSRIFDTDGLEAQPVTIAFTVLPPPSAPGSDPTPVPNTTSNPLINPVTLDWPAFPNATIYTVHYKSASAGSWSNVSKGSSTSHDISCAETVEYLWYVTATNDSGSLDFPGSATPWSFTGGYYKPGEPALFSPDDGATDIDPTNAVLDWNSSAYADSYRLYYKATSSIRYVSVSGISDTTYTLTNLNPGTSYTWYVRAYHEGNYSDYKARGFSTLSTAPNAPSNVGLTLTGVRDGLLFSVTWTDNSRDENGFEIQGRSGGTGTFPVWNSWATLKTVGADTTTASETYSPAPPRGTWFQAQVSAYNGGGNSAYAQSREVRY